MNSKQFQINRRGVISLVLAVVTLTLTALPALAWTDEGGPNFQPARSCQAGAVGEGFSTRTCGETSPHYPRRVISDQPVTALGVIRAEILFLQGWQPEPLMVKAGQ